MRRDTMIRLACAVLVVCAMWTARPDTSHADEAGSAQPAATARYRAVTRPKHDLHMGFTVSGLVSDVAVKPGQHVKEGQTLIELRHDEPDALITLWDKRRKSTTAIDAAIKRRDLAKLEETQLRELVERSGASPMEHTRAKLQLDLENLNVASAREEQGEAEQQYQQALAMRARYILTAPRDGVVEVVNVDKGELVETVQPVLHMVDTRWLRMDVMVPTRDAFERRVGDVAIVSPRDHPERIAMKGVVTEIASVADGSSDTRRIAVELKNTANLPAGMHVWVTFTGENEQQAAAR